MRGHRKPLFFALILMVMSLLIGASAEAQVMYYHGQLQRADGTAVASQATQFRAQILSPNPSACVLFEEIQTITTGADGSFTIPVGATNPTGIRDAFRNDISRTFNFSPGQCASGTSYTPASAYDTRSWVLSFSFDGTTWDTFQTETIGQTGFALDAASLQGLSAGSFLQVGTGDLTQSNLQSVFASGNAAKLVSLLATPPASYITVGSNSTITIPTASSPSSLSAGSIWLESGVLKYYDGAATKTLSSTGASVTSVSVSAPLTNSGTATAPVLGISQATSSTSGYLSSTDWNAFNGKLGTSLPSGKIWVGDGGGTAAAVSASGDATLDSSGSFTVKKIQGVSVSTTAPSSSGQVLRYDNSSTSYVPSLLSISDISGLTTALGGKIDATNMPASCSSNQTLTFSSPTGSWSCSNISITGTAFGSQAANAVFAAPDSSSGDPIFRALVAADIPSLPASKITSGTVGVANGGTGLSSVTTNSLLYGNGTSALNTLASSSSSVLTTNGSGVPQWSALTADTFTQYALLTGRSGGQTLNGGTASAESLTLDSTANGTKGSILLAPSGGNVGIGTTTPGAKLEIASGTADVSGLKFTNFNSSSPTSTGQPVGVDASGNLVTVAVSGSGTVNSGTTKQLAWYSSTGSAVSGLATANSGVLVTDGSGVPSIGSTLPTAVQDNITRLGTVTSGTWNGSLIGAQYGGTGVNASAAANGQLLIGNGTGFTLAGLTGTANQVNITNAAGSITLSLPQNIHSGASPTFTALTLSSMSTAGIVKNSGSGVLSGGNTVSLDTEISGTLGVANGGTGLTTVATNSLLYGNGTGALNTLASSNSAVLTSNASGIPQWSSLSSDTFTQYAILAGRAGGQTLKGGTAASENLTIESTSDATKGNILIAASGGNVGIGTTSPGAKLEVSSGTANVSGLKFTNFNSSSPTSTGQPVGVDVNGNLITVSVSGSGTVNTGTSGQLAWYSSNSSAVSGNANVTTNNGVLSLGQAGSVIGGLNLSGNTSGTVSINPQAAAGTYNFNLPTTAGTSGQVLTSGGGSSSPMTWTTLATSATTDTTNAGNISSGTLDSARLPTIPVTKGGTGLTSVSANSLLYASANDTLATITPVANAVLVSDGSKVPAWTAITNDPFTQYAWLGGRNGGQILKGGTAANNNLTLESTSDSTKGAIVLAPNAGNVGVGTTAPGAKLEIASGAANVSGLKFTNFNSSSPTGTGQPVGVDVSGNLVTIPVSGSGTVNSGTANQLAWYNSTGSAVSGNSNVTATNGILSLGQAGSVIGGLNLSGNTSGTVSINPQAAAGTYNFNLPTTAGTSGQVLTSGGGSSNPMTWTTLATSATTDTTNASNISSGTLGVARLPTVTVPYGGTGLTTIAANSLLYGNNTGNMNVLAPTNSAVLTSNASGVPQWSPLSSDTFTQYALLAGRSSGQTLTGGTAASENLTLDSTSNSTKGAISIAANNSLTMASGTGQFTQTYTGTTTSASTLTANSVTTAAAQSITANGLTSGSILSLSSNSTAATSGNKGLNISISGANSNSSVARTGLNVSVTSTGTTSTNVGARFSASGATNNYALLVPDGRVGIGTASPLYRFDLYDSTTATSGNVYSAVSEVAANPASASDATYIGMIGNSSFWGANSPNAIAVGLYGASTVGSGNVGLSTGVASRVTNSGTETVTDAIGLDAIVQNASTGTITSAYGVSAEIIKPSGTIVNGYGIYVGQVQATTAYGIYQVDNNAKNYFAGNVGIGTTNPSEALEVKGRIAATAPDTTSVFCGTTGFGNTVTFNGNDTRGTVAVTSAFDATKKCIITFSRAWTNPPVCVVSFVETTISSGVAIKASTTTTELTVEYTGPIVMQFSYICLQ